MGDVGKLREIAERLQNVGRGVQRLKAAVGKVGLDALAAACRELKLSSTLTDDIPDTKVLRELVDRLERQAEALAPTKPGLGVPPRRKQTTVEPTAPHRGRTLPISGTRCLSWPGGWRARRSVEASDR